MLSHNRKAKEFGRSRESPCNKMPLHHDCQHDTITRRAPVVVHQRRHPRRRRLQSGPAAPLRVRFHPLFDADVRTCYAVGAQIVVGDDSQPFNCTAASQLTPEKRVVLTQLLDAASAWLSAAFSVVEPLSGPLSVASTPCGFGGGVTIPAHFVTSGALETDVLAFVTGRPILGAVLAYAGHCQEDQGGTSYVPRRPSVGHINIDPASLSSIMLPAVNSSFDEQGPAAAAANAAVIDDLLGLLLHETFHMLGFSRTKLLELPCPGALNFNRHQANTYELRPCAAGGSIEPVVQQPTADGLTTPLLISPRVVDTARRHFGCATLFGVPLEACLGSANCLSGTGTAASHWEKRVLLGEVMVGAASPHEQRVVSNLSLAVFDDFGFYAPHYAVGEPRCFYRPLLPGCSPAEAVGGGAGGDGRGGGVGSIGTSGNGTMPPRESLLWGARAGCEFVEGACSGPSWRAQGPGYWCAAHPNASLDEQRLHVGAESCTVGRRAVGRCTLREFDEALPQGFRYFAALPSLGGRAMEDYCPVVAPSGGWDCQVPPHPSSPQAESVHEAALRRGEARCTSCRCFTSSLYNQSGYVTGERRGCFPHRCASPTRLQVKVGGSWYDCNAFNQSIAVSGWTGLLRCPDAAELCRGASDLNWPEIHAIQPSHGPSAGGTLLAIRGRHLVGNSTEAPTVRICGRVAIDVRVINGFRDESNGTNVSGRLANNENAHVLALTPARLESEAVADAVRCDVLVNPNGGYEALGWFTYDGDPPAACHLLSDLFKGDFTSMDWTSVDQLIALFVCVCPMVLSAIATAAALGLGWMVRTRGRTLYRLKAKAKQRRSRERRLSEAPL